LSHYATLGTADFALPLFLLPLPRRFHERNFELKSGQQKPSKTKRFSRA
jgi:hypothetical protein